MIEQDTVQMPQEETPVEAVAEPSQHIREDSPCFTLPGPDWKSIQYILPIPSMRRSEASKLISTIENHPKLQHADGFDWAQTLFDGASMGPMYDRFQKAIDDNVLNIYKGKTKLLASELKDSDAAVLGASALGWELRDIK